VILSTARVGRRLVTRALLSATAAAVALVLLATAAQAAPLPAETVKAREHFFGPENVDSSGKLRRDRVILSWFSVASFAAAIDGRVVLLDSYIHKGENRPNYVPTTTAELANLRPQAVFIGHGHFDHADGAAEIAARTGALLVGTPEHCEQARRQAAEASAAARVRCLAAAGKGSEPGAQLRELRPLGSRVGVTALKHVHSATEPPDGGQHESNLVLGAPPDPGSILLHPPGPSLLTGLSLAGAEAGTMMYQFRVGRFALVWHDSSGPLRERAPQVFKALGRLPQTDVQVGATLGFNEPTNGMRDPVDYVASLQPEIFYPSHHDFVAEYGASRGFERTFRRELARRPGVRPEVRWLTDPYDYVRPRLMAFDVEAPRFASTRRSVTLTGLRLSRKRFRSARRGRAVAPRGRTPAGTGRLGRRVGTRVRYRLSSGARVTFRVQRARRGKGRAVGARCVRRTRRNAGLRRCTRYRTLRGKFTHRGKAGVNRLRWSGRLRGRRLKRGRYRLIARARRGTGLRSTQVRARFRIVRR